MSVKEVLPMFKSVHALAAISLVLVAPLTAQERSQEWLERCRSQRGSGERHCELREYTLSAPGGVLLLSASANGGVRVMAADRADVRVVARVESRAKSMSDAQALAGNIEVTIRPGEVRSKGPKVSGNQGWAVSYDVWAPASTSLRMSTVNGGLTTEGMTGDIEAETTNGAINLTGVRGAVSARTTNGGIDIAVAGGNLGGIGIAAKTTNGGIRLMIPEGLNAGLGARVVNGGIDIGFPVQVTGRIGKNLQTSLGSGGPPIDLETVNGGITIRRP